MEVTEDTWHLRAMMLDRSSSSKALGRISVQGLEMDKLLVLVGLGQAVRL